MLTRLLLLTSLVVSGCVPTLVHYRSATGTVTGKAVDDRGRPVAGAEITASYYAPFISLLPPAPNAMFAGKTVTRADGTFALTTRHRVEQLSAYSPCCRGDLRGVEQTGNIIRMTPRPPLPPPHP
jgi:hypothetical protein